MKTHRINYAYFLVLLFFIFIYNGFKTKLPKGLSNEGKIRDSEVKFIYDLSYKKDGDMIYEKNIFSKIKSMVEEAEEFIIIDMFLFGEDLRAEGKYEDISNQLSELLTEKKDIDSEIQIVFITDEINSFYGSYEPKNLKNMRKKGIQVVYTDLEKLPDSNPIYSGIWRSLFNRIKTNKPGKLPNPFGPMGPKTKLSSCLRALNMKANHRKVIITEKDALVTSFNVHDPSSNHSNIGLVIKGELINDLLESENEVVRLSGGKTFNLKERSEMEINSKSQLLTEGKIKNALLEEINNTGEGDEINIAMFYLSNMDIIEGLLKASARGVDIKIILDANKDAFGRQKNGIPNRPAANKLVNDSGGRIQVRWYKTHGEQFHTKMTSIFKKDETILIAGSANLTRRNIEDYNLETNLRVLYPRDSSESNLLRKYFMRIWNNEDAEYTVDFETYEEKSILKYIIYFIQEKTGLASF